jgi:hypothetical protein
VLNYVDRFVQFLFGMIRSVDISQGDHTILNRMRHVNSVTDFRAGSRPLRSFLYVQSRPAVRVKIDDCPDRTSKVPFDSHDSNHLSACVSWIRSP